jgi:MerR family mercuric resistance operon transcriptional regulator
MGAVQLPLTIGKLAAAAGVNVETVRYYQRRGLISEPHKPPGGQRKYTRSALEQIEFIRRAQALGFSLAEIKDLLAISDGKSTRRARVIAEGKLAFLDRQIGQLGIMRRRLKRLIEASRRAAPGKFCPIIAELIGADGAAKTR